jgi:D-glycero-D-manno-heptose 1,7-bisphosphate phosphatase
MSGARAAVFLDRDGVINRSLVRGNVTHPPSTPEEFEFLPGVAEACQRLHEAGFPLVVVTNQPDVARGATSRSAVEELNDLVRAVLPVLDVLCCFHDDADDCECRKPKPGMLHEASKKWNLDLSRSFLVGDRWSDIVAGQSAGCRAVLIDTPFSRAERCNPDGRAADLSGAVEWILTLSRRRDV